MIKRTLTSILGTAIILTSMATYADVLGHERKIGNVIWADATATAKIISPVKINKELAAALTSASKYIGKANFNTNVEYSLSNNNQVSKSGKMALNLTGDLDVLKPYTHITGPMDIDDKNSTGDLIITDSDIYDNSDNGWVHSKKDSGIYQYLDYLTFLKKVINQKEFSQYIQNISSKASKYKNQGVTQYSISFNPNFNAEVKLFDDYLSNLIADELNTGEKDSAAVKNNQSISIDYFVKNSVLLGIAINKKNTTDATIDNVPFNLSISNNTTIDFTKTGKINYFKPTEVLEADTSDIK